MKNRKEEENTELAQTMVKLDLSSNYATKITELIQAYEHNESLGNPLRNKSWPVQTYCAQPYHRSYKNEQREKKRHIKIITNDGK